MTTRYQKRHYEDVARTLHGQGRCECDTPSYDGIRRCVGCRTHTAIVEEFADLFAADNPPQACVRCKAAFPRPEDEDCPCSAYGTSAPVSHSFDGFDRARFLVACGLESEG